MARGYRHVDLLELAGTRLYYRVWCDVPMTVTGKPPIPNIAEVSLLDVAEALPHGSGLDSDWHITLRRDGGLTLRTEWHAMNQHGYYTGYYPVMVVVDSTLAVTDVRVNSRATNDVGDYLAETVQYCLDELTKPKTQEQPKEVTP